MINLPIQSSKTCSKRADENKIPEVQAQEVYLKTFMGLMNGQKVYEKVHETVDEPLKLTQGFMKRYISGLMNLFN